MMWVVRSSRKILPAKCATNLLTRYLASVSDAPKSALEIGQKISATSPSECTSPAVQGTPRAPLPERVKEFLLPMWKLDLDHGELRVMLTSFTSHSGLCYAIMGGAAAAALFALPAMDQVTSAAADAHTIAAETHAFLAHGIPKPVESMPPPPEFLGWTFPTARRLREVSYELFAVSLFVNLQGLMTSMNVLGWSHTLSDRSLPAFLDAHPYIVGFTGWCLVPAIATLGAGVVSTTLAQMPQSAPLVITSFVLLGAVSSLQTIIFLVRVPSLRKRTRHLN